jgi:hypothetical protein
MTRRRILVVQLAVACAGLAVAGSAAAATDVSSNWSGYAVAAKKSSTKLKTVSGSWIVPAGTCTPGQTGYSATWVGLGGYARTSRALEQTGTEFDCSASGEAQYSAWYELVPAPGKDIAMTVEPGDAIDAAVTANGQRVTILLRDRTRRETFKRTFTMERPDVSTAEWIVEAPSACDASGARCQQLPVSNFGTVAFQKAHATTVRGHAGSISDSAWAPTTIELDQSSGGGRFQPVASAAGATPSSLSADGSSFSVSYTEAQSTGGDTTVTPGTGGGRFPWTLPRR